MQIASAQKTPKAAKERTRAAPKANAEKSAQSHCLPQNSPWQRTVKKNTQSMLDKSNAFMILYLMQNLHYED
jgi:hypothetical protein